MINWNDAPEWAQYVAIDDDGQAWFFEVEPNYEEGEWYSGPGRVHPACLGGEHAIQERPNDQLAPTTIPTN